MSTNFTELRSEAIQVDTQTSAPTGDDVYEGRIYFDTATQRLYVYVNSTWRYVQLA
jgi:hypothetical protein